MNIPLPIITCCDENYYPYMKGVFDAYCRTVTPNFTIDSVVCTRSKKIANGKCCWTVYYRSTHGMINTKELFKAAVASICAYVPCFSRVVASGRYGSSQFGLFVMYENTRCICNQDFDQIMTQFRLLEPSNSRILIISIDRTDTNILDSFSGFSDDDDEDHETDYVFLDLIVSNVTHFASTEKRVTEPQWVIYRKELLADDYNIVDSDETIKSSDILTTKEMKNQVFRQNPSGLVEIEMNRCMEVEMALILNWHNF